MLKLTAHLQRARYRYAIVILAVGLGLGANRLAQANPLSVTRIAASIPGSSFEFAYSPAISAHGTIAYVANPAPGIVAEGVYRQVQGSSALAAPASVTGGIYGYAGLSVNDTGTIAFQDFNAIYAVTGSDISTVAAPGISSGIGVTYPSIADDGTVIFGLRDSFSSVTVRTATGPLTHDLAQGASSALVQAYAGFNGPGQVPMISGNGNAAYLWIGADGTTPELAFYHSGASSVVTTLAPLGALYFNVNNDAIAFFGQPAGAGQGLYVGDDTGINPIALPAGLQVVGPLSFNNHGTIAFQGNQSAQTFGIWTTDSPLPVIKIGDPLDGSIVTGLNFGPHGLSDDGQIVFSAMLANGSSGVYVLTPVPEPGSVVLVLVAAACLVATAAHRRWHWPQLVVGR